ncbi:hypothetical protein MVEN_02645700 [Mycena venus]|uniref:Uncharacterized protein n=1 Tax=Mycena venus TaxID=2733690 RepID=A0A8H6TWN6_9AGAR|nr:hypothetical protein MVEN_02645700 [Mycena venus]
MWRGTGGIRMGSITIRWLHLNSYRFSDPIADCRMQRMDLRQNHRMTFLPLHSDPPRTAVPRPRPDDGYTSGDAVVGVTQIIIQPQKLPNPKLLASSLPSDLNKKPTLLFTTSSTAAREALAEVAYRVEVAMGGVGEGPTVNYHMNAGANVHHIQRQAETGFHILHRQHIHIMFLNRKFQ